MNGRKTRILSLLTALALCASTLLLPASAAGTDGVTVWSDSIGGKSAKIVTVSMTPGRTGQVSLANNSVVDAVSAQAHINAANAQTEDHVVAAINGGFFNSYTKGTPSFPGQCPEIMNAVVTGGKLVHTGLNATIGFTADGRAMVDWVTLKAQVKLGNGFTAGCWSVNTYESDPEAIMLFDEHLTLPVTVPATSTMFYIQDGMVDRATPGGLLTPPSYHYYVLVYNSAVYDIEKGHNRLPEAGMTAQVQTAASGTDRDALWAGVPEAAAGGPLLVKDGVNVVDDARNQGYYGDPKQRPDAVLARSFIGVTGSGSLVMGTVSASFRQIADWMVANGIQEGLAMDGGASSTLYANGTFVTPAGRNLASMLTIVDKGQPDVPSAWAQAEVQAAIDAGLVPQHLQSAYRSPIDRGEFCQLIWEMLQTQPDHREWLRQHNSPMPFDDTRDEAVYNCARLGIVNGVNEYFFDPARNLKRSEAAKILALTTQLLKGENGTTAGTSSVFSDRASFGWAQEFIDYCAANQIMNGEGTAFNPNGTFSREQAILTVARIYQRYGK